MELSPAVGKNREGTRLRSRASMVVAILGLASIGGDLPAAAQPQQSETSVQSAVRDLRDSIQRSSPSTTTRSTTGASSAAAPPARPDGRSETSACAQRDRQACRK